jgi:hypothetical protein
MMAIDRARIRFVWKSISNLPKEEGIYVIRDYDGQMAFGIFKEGKFVLAPDSGDDFGDIIAWWPLPPMGEIADR